MNNGKGDLRVWRNEEGIKTPIKVWLIRIIVQNIGKDVYNIGVRYLRADNQVIPCSAR